MNELEKQVGQIRKSQLAVLIILKRYEWDLKVATYERCETS